MGAQGYLCGDFKKHLTAASDSGHRGMDEPSLTGRFGPSCLHDLSGHRTLLIGTSVGFKAAPNLFFFRHKVVSTTDLIRCNGRPVRHGRHVRLLCTDGDYMPKGIYVGTSRST